MKNLIEELNKLDQEQYNISENFSENVMKKINKQAKTNVISKVIPWASLGIAACMAVVMFTNSNVKNNFENFKESSDSSVEQENIIQINDVNMSLYDDLSSSAPSAGLSEEIYKEEISTDMTGFEQNRNEEANKFNEQYKILTVIKALIEDAKIEVEEVDEGLKVKASKDKIKDVLMDYDNVIIETQDDECVIVKLK